MFQQIIQKHIPMHWHGIAFDLIFVVLNFSLFPLLDSKIQGLFDDSFREDNNFFVVGILIIGLFLWRLLALYLKRKPFMQTFAYEETSDEQNIQDEGCLVAGVVWFLSLFSSLLGMAGLITAILTLSKNSGLGDFSNYDNAIGFFGLAIIAFEFALLYRLFKTPTKEEIEEIKAKHPKFNRNINSPRELFADLGLFGYIFLWQAFFNYFMAVVIEPNAFRSIWIFIGSTILSILVFVMFYIGPRSVFLFEDAKYGWTWLTILLVFLSSFVSHLLF